MKALFTQIKQNALHLTALACLMMSGSISAHAIAPSQVGRTFAAQTVSAICNTGFCNEAVIEPKVSLTEPATVTPVIVTWSADYNTTGTSVVGMSLNGGPCAAYGPFVLQQPQLIAGSNSITVSGTRQWVILPSDGLVKGTNTFQMCLAGYEELQVINVGYSSLTVQSQ